MRTLTIVGGGGFAGEVAAYLGDVEGLRDLKLRGYVALERSRLPILQSVPYLGQDEAVSFADGDGMIVALGDCGLRRRVTAAMEAKGARLCTLVHPSAYVGPTATLEEGTVLCPFAFVGPGAVAERGVLVNTFASIGHDSRAGAFATLSPYAALNGFVTLGSECFLGSGAIVTPGLRVGEKCKIAAGAVVYADAAPGSLLRGNPAEGRVIFKV